MKRLLILLLFSVFALSAMSQNNTVIEPKVNAQTIQGLDSNDFVRTVDPLKITAEGTVNQILEFNADGTMSPITNAAATGIVGVDASNISAVQLFTTVDTNTASFGHNHTEYLLWLHYKFPPITTVNAATYDLLSTDEILHVTYTATGVITITLPTAEVISGRHILIKDTGNAGTNNITIDTEGSETIDGAATLIINGNYSGVALYSNGTNWFIKYILP